MSACHILFLGLAMGLLLVDYLQTSTIISESRWRERNPVIRWIVSFGRDPREKWYLLTVYFGVCVASTAALTVVLFDYVGDDASLIFIGAVTIAELICTVNNRLEGIEAKGP